MSDDTSDLRVREFLRDRGTELRISLIVFAHQHEMHGLAADLHLLAVGLLDCETRAVFIVLAEMRDAAGQRTRVTDGDGHRFVSGRFGRFRGLFRLFLLTAAVRNEQRGAHERVAELACE